MNAHRTGLYSQRLLRSTRVLVHPGESMNAHRTPAPSRHVTLALCPGATDARMPAARLAWQLVCFAPAAAVPQLVRSIAAATLGERMQSTPAGMAAYLWRSSSD
eukprot:2846922-Prymnesium_polylepis.2